MFLKMKLKGNKMFNKSVDEVLETASKVIDDLEAAASRASTKASAKRETISLLENEADSLDKEAVKGDTVAKRFKALITVDE